MSSDSSGLRDEVHAALDNPDDDPGFEVFEAARGNTDQAEPVPGRPADGAPKWKWVDYCVALGADRTFISENTEHYDDEHGGMVTESALARDDLIDLADRLGG